MLSARRLAKCKAQPSLRGGSEGGGGGGEGVGAELSGLRELKRTDRGGPCALPFLTGPFPSFLSIL